jgi:hypothetical protein
MHRGIAERQSVTAVLAAIASTILYLLQRIQAAYSAHATASHLLRTAFSDKANPAYRAIAGFLCFVEGRYSLYVPQNPDLRRKLLSHCHDHDTSGHPGQTWIEHSIRVHFYWPQMCADISDYVYSCRHCQLPEHSAQSPSMPTTFPCQSIPLRTSPSVGLALCH